MNNNLSLNINCCDKEQALPNDVCTPIKRNSPLLDHSRNISPVWKNQNAKRINNIYYQLKSNYCLNELEIKSYITESKNCINKFIKILKDKNQYSKENIENYIKFYTLYDKTLKNHIKHIEINDEIFVI